MDTVKDSFLDLERRRRQLEQNVAELQASLKHWQTWEAEYEGFKEELQALGDDALPTSIQATADDFEGELLTADEISKLVRDGKGNLRDSKQIQGLLSRRVDYVQENVKSAQKRYEAAGSKLAAVSIVMQPEARDEEGLPLTEITEELDEDDNIICRFLTSVHMLELIVPSELITTPRRCCPANSGSFAETRSQGSPRAYTSRVQSHYSRRKKCIYGASSKIEYQAIIAYRRAS